MEQIHDTKYTHPPFRLEGHCLLVASELCAVPSGKEAETGKGFSPALVFGVLWQRLFQPGQHAIVQSGMSEDVRRR